jgi:hypothetical protein
MIKLNRYTSSYMDAAAKQGVCIKARGYVRSVLLLHVLLLLLDELFMVNA